MTSTRSISVMALMVLWLLIFFRLNSGLAWLWLAATPLLGLMLNFTVLQDAGVWTRIVNTLNEGGLDGSTSFRMFILESYFSYVGLDDLLFGLGLGSFHLWFQKYTDVPDVAPHFEWLWIISEFGLPVFLIYMVYGLALLGIAFHKWRSQNIFKHEFLVVLLFVSIPQLFLQLANPFYFYQFVVVFGVMAGIALDRSEILDVRILRKDYV